MFGKRYTVEGFVIILIGIVLTLSVGGVAVVSSISVSEGPLGDFVGGQMAQYIFIGLLIPALALLNRTITSSREYERPSVRGLHTVIGPVMVIIGWISFMAGTMLVSGLTDSMATEPLSFNAVFEMALLITAIGFFLFATGSITAGLGLSAVAVTRLIRQFRKVENLYEWILMNPHVEIHRQVREYRKARGMGVYESYLEVLSKGIEATSK